MSINLYSIYHFLNVVRADITMVAFVLTVDVFSQKANLKKKIIIPNHKAVKR